MSIGNTNLHQRGEIPEIVKLPNGRIRVIRRFHKFTREDVDNANLGSLMGDFGDLDTTDEQIANQGYTNCRLISVEVDTRFNSVSNTDSAVLVKTYETLTNLFVQITDDTVTFTDNGLKQITRVYRANSGITSSNVVGVTTLNTGEFLASSRIEDNDAFAELTETYIEAGILSRTEDFVGSQDSLVIEAIGPDPSTPSGFSLASKQESNYEGFQTNRFTFLKNDVQLSQTEDKVGSQLAISQQWFNPSADKTLAGYSLASKNISDFEGIETVEYRFLKDDVVLSESEDKVGSQLAIVQEVFNGTPITPSGYSLANEQVSDFEGIPTRRYTFLKNNVELSRSEDKIGSQLAITTEVFNPTADPIETGYSVARKEVSDVGGIPTKRFTLLKDDAELSRSEDLVGSQLAITTQVFNPTSDPTESGYSLARTEVSDVDGIPTKRFTFLKNNAILSVSEDKVGSQNAVVNEVFNPTSEAITGIDTDGTALSGYSEANRTESNYGGIKTIRVQFLKDDVLLSKSEDEVGSQNAITEQWFKPIVSRGTKTGYSLARTEESDVDGIPTERYTFLKPSILSVQQEFNNGLKRVSVQAFNLDSAAVSAALNTIITSHKLIATNESDYAGIKTTTFQYQIDESFTEDYELNGLKRISLIELSATNFSAQVIGGLAGESATPPAEDPPNVVPAGSPTIGLYLGTQDIDNGGTIRVRKSVWIQAGTISVNTKNLSEGVTEVTTVSIGTEVTPIGPVLRKSVNNFNGLETYSVTELQNGNGESITNGVANSYERLVPFSYPGVVSLTHERINGSSTNASDGYHVLAFHLNPPVQVKTEATVDVSFQTSGSISSSDFTHNTSVGYWNPLSWAETFQSGVAHGPNPFADSQGLRGYRIDLDNGVENIGTFNGSSNNRTYITNGVIVMTRYTDSLDAYVGESWEYDNASFYFPRAEVLYTGQTSGAKAYLKQWGSASAGTLTLTRSGSGTNAIPFQANEVIRSAQAQGGNPFTLRRSVGGSVNIFGTSDGSGNKFSLNGKRLYASTAYFAKLSGGPENPSNKRWVLDVNIEPAFQDIDGVNYYKKTIVTSDIL